MIDLTTIIVAALGLVGTALGVVLKRKGERRQEDAQAAANRLAERDNEFDRLVALNGRLESENTRLHTARASDQQQCAAAQAGLASTVTMLAEVVRDEVAREAARIAVERAKRHEATDHD